MPNNRKPKLAPGSRMENSEVVDEDGCVVSVYSTLLDCAQKSHAMHIRNAHSAYVADALAAIRAAKLDPVFDSSVALAEYWDRMNDGQRSLAVTDCPMLGKLLSANSADVKGATDA